ncbi:MAG TPA: AAA-like domain-containing protein [Pyrinomonadaceae bacterium]|nr:AAA-like domain-containing protein [Pyrinomonadaceae bacterium]
MPNKLDPIKNACAYIDAGEMRGTGYLVAPNIAVTCNHVVNRVTNGQPVALRFGNETRQARVLVRDPDADCAILELTTPITGVEPLSLTPNDCDRGDLWEAYGFPAITGEAGHFLSGEVQDPLGKDPSNTEAIVLYSREIAAAEGAPPQGFSGTPVLVDGYVVGHLKKIIPGARTDNTSSRAMMGTLYACPSRLVTRLLPATTRRVVLTPQPATTGYDPVWYVPRTEAEEIAKNYLKFPGTPVVLWGPFRSGKTTTLKYLIEQVRSNTAIKSKIVTVNLGLLDSEAQKSLDTFLKEMARVVAEKFNTDSDLVDKNWNGGTPNAKFTRLMRDHLLPRVEENGRLVLAIDRADEIWRRPFRGDFFSLLRSWAGDVDAEIFSRLRLILAVSSSPLFLIDDPNKSPFNLTDPIELKDLDPDQIRILAERYGLHWNNSDLQSVRNLVGGQPYLLRVLMFRANLNRTPVSQLLEPENLTQVYANYFDQYRAWLYEKKELANELRRFTSAPLKNDGSIPTLSADNKDACHTLTRAGLLVLVPNSNDQYRLRYGLYRYLFN